MIIQLVDASATFRRGIDLSLGFDFEAFAQAQLDEVVKASLEAGINAGAGGDGGSGG